MTSISSQISGSTKPYLIRAIYEWAVDQHLTPQILVDVALEGVVVPKEYVKDDQIVLNIHPQSVKDLELGNEFLLFSARFAGRPFEVCIPVTAVTAIYSRENGQGIVFQMDGSGQNPPEPDGGDGVKKSKELLGPRLKLVK